MLGELPQDAIRSEDKNTSGSPTVQRFILRNNGFLTSILLKIVWYGKVGCLNKYMTLSPFNAFTIVILPDWGLAVL